MPITKSDLINETAIACGIARDYAKVVIEQFFDAVISSIKAENSLEIRGFGTFSPKTCNPRAGRNLKTGELIPLAASRSMSLKFSSELKVKVASKQTRHRELAKTDSQVKSACIQ